MPSHAERDRSRGDEGERKPGAGNAGAAVDRDDVSVAKTIETDPHPVPVVEYVIESSVDAPVTVRVLDALPDAVEPSDVGFHEEYYGDDWQVRDEETVAFERELGPRQTLTTVFGVRSDPATVEAIDETPVLQVEPDEGPTGDGDDDAGEDIPATLDLDDPTADVGGDSSETAPGPDQAGEAESQPSESEEAATDPDGRSDRGASTVESDGASEALENLSVDVEADAEDGAGTGSAPPVEADGSVANALVAELREGELDEDQRQALQGELSLRLSDSTSAFVEHVQSRLRQKRDRLESEIETLEESIQELYGLKADASAVDRVDRRLSDVEDAAVGTEEFEQLERFATHLDEAKADLERVERIEAVVEEHREAVDALGDAKADDERVEAVEGAVDDLRDVVDALGDEKADVERIDNLESAVETKADADRVDGLESTVETKADADRVDDLESTVETRAAGDDLDRLEDVVDELDDRAAAESRVDDLVADLRETKADRDEVDASLADTDERIDRLDEEKAAESRVEDIERRLDEEFVTAEDISGTIEARLDQSVAATAALGTAIGAGMLSLVLAVQTPDPTPALVAFAGCVVALTLWKVRQPAVPTDA